MCQQEEEAEQPSSSSGSREARGSRGSRERRCGRNHGVQHVRDVERGELQAGALRELLGLAAAPNGPRATDATHVVRQHKR